MILFLLFFQLTFAQINVTSYENYPEYQSPPLAYLTDIDFNKDASQIFIAVSSGQSSISRINVTDPNNATHMGDYIWSNYLGINQTYIFYSISIYKDYLIGCSSSDQRCKVWNISTYTPIGLFDEPGYFSSYMCIQSRGICIYGGTHGKLMYFQQATLPNPVVNFILNDSSAVFFDKSPDDQYLAVYYTTMAIIRVYNLSDWSVFQTLNLSLPTSCAIWTFDDRYLIIFPTNSEHFLVYTRANFSLTMNISIAYTNVQTCIAHKETNSYLCIADAPTVYFTLNLFDFSVDFLFNGSNSIYNKVSENLQVFTSYYDSSIPARFYQINKYCTGNTFYHISQKSCVVCDANCAECLSVTACKKCVANKTLENGTCRPCGSNELYNTTTFLCNDITNFCSGDQYFSIPLLTCVQCLKNCGKCISTNFCQQCVFNYTLTNATCRPCAQNELFNISSKVCDGGTPSFCSEGEFFSIPLLTCVKCQPFCLECTSSNQCSLCTDDYRLMSGRCVSLSNIISTNLSMKVLKSELIKTINKVPGNRLIYKQLNVDFINLDKLWLYLYHKRNYTESMTDLFLTVKSLKRQSWNGMLNFLLDDKSKKKLNDFITKIDFKLPQTSNKFVQIQNFGSSFLTNTLQFFCFNVPLVLVAFLLLKFLFKLFIRLNISIKFTYYTIKVFILCLIMEGILEAFCYFFFFDGTHINYNNYFQKSVNSLTLLFFVICIWYALLLFSLVKTTQKKAQLYLLRNFQTNLKSLVHLTIESGLLNFCLGACHALFLEDYGIQLITLTFVQMCYIMTLIWSLNARKVYLLKYVGWQNIIASFLRIFLILIFSLDKDIDYKNQSIYEEIQIFIVNLYIINWGISFLIGSLIVVGKGIKEIFTYLSSNKIQIKNSLCKNQQQTNLKTNSAKKIIYYIYRDQMRMAKPIKTVRQLLKTQLQYSTKNQIVSHKISFAHEKDLPKIDYSNSFAHKNSARDSNQKSQSSKIKSPQKYKQKTIQTSYKSRIKKQESIKKANHAIFFEQKKEVDLEVEKNTKQVKNRQKSKLKQRWANKIYDLI